MSQNFIPQYQMKQSNLSKWLEEVIVKGYTVTQLVRTSPFDISENDDDPKADWILIFETREVAE